MSVSSQESEQEETINISQILEEQLDNLTEKRTSTREKAIETLIKNLKMEFHYDFVKERKLTFIESIKKGIRKGSF
jgi:predicted nucleic acid-binding protein